MLSSDAVLRSVLHHRRYPVASGLVFQFRGLTPWRWVLPSASQVDRRDGKSDKKNKGRRDNLDKDKPGKGRGD